MNLSSDQCGVIAQLLPVFLLAAVVEQRSAMTRLKVGPWDANTLSAPIYTAFVSQFIATLIGIALAVVGVSGGLHGLVAIWLVGMSVSSGLMLAVMTFFVIFIEQGGGGTRTPAEDES